MREIAVKQTILSSGTSEDHDRSTSVNMLQSVMLDCWLVGKATAFIKPVVPAAALQVSGLLISTNRPKPRKPA